MKLHELLNKLHAPTIAPGSEQDWNKLLNYDVMFHTGLQRDPTIVIEQVYTDDSDNTLNIDIGVE